MSDERIKSLGDLFEIAKRRARIAQDKALLAEQRYEAALRATRQARDELEAMQENYKRERGERITEIMAAPASQVQLANIRIQYELDAQRLLLQRQKIQILKDEEGPRLMEKNEMRRLATIAKKREQKLEEVLADMKRERRGLEEFMSEMEAEQ